MWGANCSSAALFVIWIFGNPARPALIPFGVIPELEDAPLLLVVSLAVLCAALTVLLLDALLAVTGEELGEPSRSFTATDGVEVGTSGAVEPSEVGTWGP